MLNQGNDGEFQLEENFADESDLQEHFKSCLKNPDHKQFLPLKSLQLKDLPEHHQTPCILDFIYYVAQFTVRLVVDFFSPDRPLQFGQESTGEARTCLRGNRRLGSGLVTGLAQLDEISLDNIDVINTYFILVTAAHVIFDTNEAQKTEIEFFYDDPHDRSSVRKAFGLRVLNTNSEADFSEVLCYTKDKVISEKLNNRKFKRTKNDEISTKRSSPILSISDTSEQLPLKESTTNVEKSSLKENETVSQDLVFHISHPHGTSKKVTFGNIVSADTRHGHYQLIYSVATCRGSSGGPVFVIPGNIHVINYTFENLESIFSVPHSRHHGNELNSSSSATFYFYDQHELIDKPTSPIEDKRHFKQKRIRLSSLDIEDLPSGCRFYNNLNLIKNIFKFTVGIKFLNDATFDSKNMASGFVTRLANDDDIRPDLEDTTKTYFIMVTAAHVISDTSQAKETEINFFCDDLQDMSSVRKAFGLRVLNSDNETNVREVLCVTTDKDIISMLKEQFFKTPRSTPSNFLCELFSTMKESPAYSFLLSVISRYYFTIANEKKERLLFEVYMSLKSAFERLVLLILFKEIDSLASNIFLRIYEVTYDSRLSVTSQSDVLHYITFLCKCLTDKPDLKAKCFSLYSNENKEDLIECLKHTSQELYREIMLRENQKITFQISHHGTKEISFDIPHLSDDVREIKRGDVHEASPVFSILCIVSSKDHTVEQSIPGLTLRLYQYYFDLSNETLPTDGTTLTFVCYDTGPIHPIGF